LWFVTPPAPRGSAEKGPGPELTPDVAFPMQPAWGQSTSNEHRLSRHPDSGRAVPSDSHSWRPATSGRDPRRWSNRGRAHLSVEAGPDGLGTSIPLPDFPGWLLQVPT